jgi:methionine-R-sulfoxide reductase
LFIHQPNGGKILPEDAYFVMREEQTEPPGYSPLDREKRAGVFSCAGCDLPVFGSDTKFDSGTGWPSFWVPIDEKALGTKTQGSGRFLQTEVHCRRCGGHLGHIFPDGPEPTGPPLLHQRRRAEVQSGLTITAVQTTGGGSKAIDPPPRFRDRIGCGLAPSRDLLRSCVWGGHPQIIPKSGPS